MPQTRSQPRFTEAGAQPKLLATGFYNISGAAVNAKGQLFFVDAHAQRIYRWSPESGNAVLVRDAPLDPVNLIFDKSGDLVVVSSGGVELTAYAFRPEATDSDVTVLKLQPTRPRPDLTAALPVDYWFNGDFANTLSSSQPYTYTTLEQMFNKGLSTPKEFQFVSPDNSVFIPTDRPIVQGEPMFGTKWTPVLEAYGLVKATPGKPFYATNESEQRTYRGTLNEDGSLASIVPFVEQGGESLAQDVDGNVYLAAGQIFVYSPAGKLLDRIDVPERPHDILFGGADRKTLYLLTAHSLYAVRMIRQGL
jgi:sugar lactone lactonase YvrE